MLYLDPSWGGEGCTVPFRFSIPVPVPNPCTPSPSSPPIPILVLVTLLEHCFFRLPPSAPAFLSCYVSNLQTGVI